VDTLEELQAVLASADPNMPFPPEAMRMKRGKRAGRQKVTLPEGYLDDRLSDRPPGPEAEASVSGG
jgi:hypothetical protein